jgi:hypothetical protein
MTTTSYSNASVHLNSSNYVSRTTKFAYHFQSRFHARRSSKASSTYAPSWRCCKIRVDDFLNTPPMIANREPGDEAEYYILQNKYFVVRMILCLISEKIIDKVLVTVDVNWSKQCSPSVFVIRMP